jgi:hypothetical protein
VWLSAVGRDRLGDHLQLVAARFLIWAAEAVANALVISIGPYTRRRGDQDPPR